MTRFLRRLLDRLPARSRVRTDRRLRVTHARHAQFVSFLESSGYRTHNPDRYEQSLRRRRAVKRALYWLSAFGASWIVIESAKALTLF
ncbi:MAG TPA: hypothetical protein VEB66_09075 [Opitutaceae bacterium]|nr:hypothetical protein [Opitutaceae bacterium]